MSQPLLIRCSTFLRIEIVFTSALNEHPTKDRLRDELRRLRMEYIDSITDKLLETTEESIKEIEKEMDNIVDEYEQHLDKSQDIKSRKDFYEQTEHLINEYKEKLKTYKE